MHDWQSEVRARLASLHLKPEREADIVDEIAQHLAERYREAISAGASPDEATRLALAEFRAGNALAQRIAALKQAHAPASVTAGVSTGHLLENLRQDLRYSARAFRKQPVPIDMREFAEPEVQRLWTLALNAQKEAQKEEQKKKEKAEEKKQ